MSHPWNLAPMAGLFQVADESFHLSSSCPAASESVALSGLGSFRTNFLCAAHLHHEPCTQVLPRSGAGPPAVSMLHQLSAGLSLGCS